MYAETTADVSPSMRYRRHIEGTDFSLEANTDATPEAGHFYVLRGGEVELVSDEFPTAMAAYQGLCKEHWLNRLVSQNHSERMASAWGLVGLEPDHKDALEVIRTDGSDDDRKRLEQVRRRKRFAKRKPGRFAAAKS
ncbi:MAG: hypothetical protein ACO1SX_22290 [Actinomycetota bacterium]